MDYEKAYKEEKRINIKNKLSRDALLESAKKLLDGCDEIWWPNGELKKAILKDFPELAESEDEKIRKALVDLVYSDVNELIGGVEKRLCVSWLEKQKEQKPTAEEVLLKAGLKPFKDGNQWCILAGDNIQEGICGFGDTIEDALFEFLKDVCKEQKPAEKSEKPIILEWSEEDERMRKAVLDEIEHQIEIMPDADDMDSDDQDRYNELISMSVWMEDLPKCRKFHWKPSEGQMGALYAVIPQSGQPATLQSLYNDLKKL